MESSEMPRHIYNLIGDSNLKYEPIPEITMVEVCGECSARPNKVIDHIGMQTILIEKLPDELGR